MSNMKNQEAVILEHLENLDDLRCIEETKKQELNSAYTGEFIIGPRIELSLGRGLGNLV